jgi:hypothetical protein
MFTTRSAGLIVAVMVSGIACQPKEFAKPNSQGTEAKAAQPSQAPAGDVESVLKSGRWEKRSGLGSGMAWQYLDGGRVRIYDGGEIDESYRWEVLSRNEGQKTIKIRYWRPADTSNEHREFVFKFASGGDTAEVENWLRKNGKIEMRGESTQYRVR